MKKRNPLTARNFPSAKEEAKKPAAPPPFDGDISAYRLAFVDDDFLLREELRPVRMQLELLKPELIQQEQQIKSTLVIFGSARILPRDTAEAAVAAAEAGGDTAAQSRARTQLAMSRYYEEARRFADIVTRATKDKPHPIYVVTGGGPGIMEAGNRGAFEAGGRSIGLNIVLPHEQAPNPYITPELCFRFHYFALRKMHFLMRSVALVAFPGGYGTMDELFEALTLIQTGKCRRRPVLMFGREFWTRLINFEVLVETGMISPGDEQLFHFVETAEEAWALLENEYDLSGDNADAH
ncbi:TIGR00730 family Rossman fold protein [Pelomonas sp. SE-A7]|uniref:LOG family protein n=1 Tax=Pelomonas sp. SE-A7 TaxID=3054953 RepID=UPI00259CB769|nr:TIGR00730 family Rossman fold protein [Pelomonas sp. SE-A7]MDM4766001.1 TIGR00730 family Rossman fold protein [Pelomonas sp. SE-A7]